jgi:cysteine desulfurase
MERPLYLDYNATTPIHPEVAAAMRPVLETTFGNPSSGHAYGRAAAALVTTARHQVATLLGCDPDEVTFTGGGTESNNLAIQGIAYARRDRGNHLVTTTVEHPAVDQVMTHLEGQGFDVTRVTVDGHGRVDPRDIAAAMTPKTILVSVMHANNEVGTIMPLSDIAAVCRDRSVALHTDAAQSVGKIPTAVHDLGVDLLSVAGHKLYAPKGVGALYVRRNTTLVQLMHGADHESGLRPGTENVLGIVGLGRASALATSDLETHAEHQRSLRDRLHQGLVASLPADAVRLHGHPTHRLPNTLNVGFRALDAATLLESMPQVAASAGAACHAGDDASSSVLGAMGVDPIYAAGAVRFSTGRLITKEEVDRAIAYIVAAAQSQTRSTYS